MLWRHGILKVIWVANDSEDAELTTEDAEPTTEDAEPTKALTAR